MPAWYDIHGFSHDSRQDTTGMHRSAQAVLRLIQAEMAAGIPANRIILGGFSQGAAITLFTQYSLLQPMGIRLGGLMVLSGYLPRGLDLMGIPAVVDSAVVAVGQCHQGEKPVQLDLACCKPQQPGSEQSGDKQCKEGDDEVVEILVCHGDKDQVIPFEYAKHSADRIREAANPNVKLTFKAFHGMAHSVSEEEVALLAEFIHGKLEQP